MSFANDHGTGDMFNAHMSTQNNNTGGGNQFPGASFLGTVNIIQNTQNERSLKSRGIDVLKRLYVSKYRDQKDRNPDRIPGTCEWFVTHPTFKDWQKAKMSQMLWVSANPGCGKSVLARYLADSVLVTKDSGRTVGYFFFKDDFEDQRSATNALCCILHQLFDHRRDLLTECIIEKFEINERIVDSFSDLWNVLISAAKQKDAGEIICLLDAFDECEHHGWSQLTKKLRSLYTGETWNTFNLKFLITSRPYGHIRHGFQPIQIPGQPLIHLSGENDDEMEKISYEINLFIEKKVNTIGAQLKLTEEEQSTLLKSVTRVPNRTYLWVSLTLDLIESYVYIDKIGIDAATSDLPATVDEAYERILSRSKDLKEARKLLHIVLGATRPLTLQEMNLALTLDGRHRSYSDLDLRSQDRFREYIQDICGLFVTVVDHKIYLLHQTAREFLVQDTPASIFDMLYHLAKRILFQYTQKGSNNNIQSPSWKHSFTLQDSHRIIGTICIQYLLLSDFGKAWPLETDIGNLTKSYIFLDYSAKFWVTHLLESNTKTDNMELSLLTLCDLVGGRHPIWFQVYWTSVGTDFPTGFTSLMIASYFELLPVVKHWIEMDTADIDAKDHVYGRSALSWAAGNGHTAVVKLLINWSLYRPRRKTAEVDALDSHRRTPLCWAILNGHANAVNQLLEVGAAIDLEDDIGGTPFQYAACSGNSGVWNLVVKKGSQKHHPSIDNIKGKLLISAAMQGDEEVVRIMLDNNADIESKSIVYSETPLSRAAKNGHEAVVRLLLENKADIESKDDYGRTPLYWAVKNGHEDVVRLLLENKADIESKDNEYGRSPLFLAVYNGHEAMIRLLLKNNADIESKDNEYGQTPLFRAAGQGHEDVVRLLLQNSVSTSR